MLRGKQIICIFFFTILIIGCGPSEQAIATMTASAWTPTPEPTATPTPVPVDLEVTLQDTEGNPIIYDVSLAVLETGEDPVTVNKSGKAAYSNLPDVNVTILAEAQGYLQKEESVNLDRGKNTVVIAMEEDPYQIVPSRACQPGQEIIWLEDFEDNMVQGWNNFSKPAFDFEEIDGRGTVLIANAENEPYIETEGDFADTVFHFDLLRDSGDLGVSIEYLNSSEEGYQAGFDGNGVNIAYLAGPESEGLKRPSIPLADGETWIKASIAFFENSYDLYVDDELIFGAIREDANTEGVLFIGIGGSGGTVAKFDNFILCGLTEPYQPLAVEE